MFILEKYISKKNSSVVFTIPLQILLSLSFCLDFREEAEIVQPGEQKAQGDLIKVCAYLMEQMKISEHGSFQGCPVTGQGAMFPHQNS